MREKLDELSKNSWLFGSNAEYLEAIYEAYIQDPRAVSASWQAYFAQLPIVNRYQGSEVSQIQIRQEFLDRARFRNTVSGSQESLPGLQHQSALLQLINAYRRHGHLQACNNPLNNETAPNLLLDMSQYGFVPSDLSIEYDVSSFYHVQRLPLKVLLDQLQATYCGAVGIEYMHITDPEEVQWLQQRLEPVQLKPGYSPEVKREILKHLVAAEGLEKFLGNKFVGQKRFSLEGGDSLVPMLNHIVQTAGRQYQCQEIIMGMAHRGRLNVLINVLGKAPADLFQEFEGKLIDNSRSGDVKYHLGYSSDIQVDSSSVHLALGFNPSHLEIIAPVIEGSVRARQDRLTDTLSHQQILPIVIHGDSAFSGQGVVMETLNMSQVRGYTTGGTLHIIVNNQVGFTTSNPADTRSTLYCTDIAKMLEVPVFHVNADDPEATLFAALIALDYRMRFKKDVIIDLVCYRRHGHNEADEPAMTQPMMYRKIRQHSTTLTLYAARLIQEQIVDQALVDTLVADYRQQLELGKPVGIVQVQPPSPRPVDWLGYLKQTWEADYDATSTITHLQALGKRLVTLPSGFTLQKQVQREFELRQKMYAGELPLHWGAAENLAYAELVQRGYQIRISGQDCGRGTFSHRHAVVHDYETGEHYTPLCYVAPNQAQFTVIDSILSEEAVLAFEYGYATTEPRGLVIWEAQFGDFANVAQVVIDQFISSGYEKWGRLCGLVLLLPHGYEGMGPEHSSARLERFMQLCSDQNMQVCIPTTPAQCYHMLRRQALRPFRKPLIVMSPKSLLRHKLATSMLQELAEGKFYEVIPEVDTVNPETITRMVLCSGKVYYDLLERRREQHLTNVAIIRIEQLYPFPQEALKQALACYPNAKMVIWCQEEPKNQGAWYCGRHHFEACLRTGQQLYYAGRKASASPAVGDMARHLQQQHELVQEALHGKCEV